jgi:hypothetical protein
VDSQESYFMKSFFIKLSDQIERVLLKLSSVVFALRTFLLHSAYTTCFHPHQNDKQTSYPLKIDLVREEYGKAVALVYFILL